MKVIGVDVGGTFTDLIYSDLDTGAMAINKVPTTPEDPSNGVMKGIEGLLASAQRKPDEIDFVFHATTTATNAVLEDKGARAGMITNERLPRRSAYGRHQRVEHYSIRQELPWQNRPLIKRRDRMVVHGRLAPPHGEELEPLDEEGVRSAAIALRDAGVESVAICFLFSYLNPAHEDRVKAIVSEILPDGVRHHILLRIPAVSRVRAIHHGCAGRLHRAEGPDVYHPPRPVAQKRGAFG